MKQGIRFPANKTVAGNGALLGIAMAFFYSIVIMAYVVTRTTLAIVGIMPIEERSTILWVNGVSVAYSVAGFSVLMAVISSLAGATSAMILKKALLIFNRGFNGQKAGIISFITAFTLVAILYIVLYVLLKERIKIKYMETLCFWYLIPASLYMVTSVIGGCRLNRGYTS